MKKPGKEMRKQIKRQKWLARARIYGRGDYSITI